MTQVTHLPIASHVTQISFRNGKFFLLFFFFVQLYSFLFKEQNINLGDLYGTVIKIKFSDNFNKPLDYCLPSNLTHLSFGRLFNTPIFFLPPSLLKLKFHGYTHPISCLPPSLTSLKFKYYNSSPFPLPDKLKHLSFGINFSQKLEYFPRELRYLKLPANYKHPLPSFPPYLENIKITFQHIFGDDNNNNISNHLALIPPLPSASTQLKLIVYLNIKKISKNDWPPVSELCICNNIENNIECWPSCLTSLEFSLNSNFNYPLLNLPPTLTKLTLLNSFDQLVDNLPPSLLYLYFGNYFNKPVDNLPPDLKYLRLGKNFNCSIDKLPLSLTCLSISSTNFDKPIEHLPPALIHLNLDHCDSFNQTIDHLPPFLKSLKLGRQFNKNVNHLPSLLQKLYVGINFTKDILTIPSSITRLRISYYSLPNPQFLPNNITSLTIIVQKDTSNYHFSPPSNIKKLCMQQSRSKVVKIFLKK